VFDYIYIYIYNYVSNINFIKSIIICFFFIKTCFIYLFCMEKIHLTTALIKYIFLKSQLKLFLLNIFLKKLIILNFIILLSSEIFVFFLL